LRKAYAKIGRSIVQNQRSYKLDEFRFIIQKSLEDSLTPDEVSFLRTAVSSNASARQYYIDYIMVHGSLFALSNEIYGKTGSYDIDVFNEALLDLAEYEKKAPSIVIPKIPDCEPKGPVVIHPAREKCKINKFNIFTLVVNAAAMLLIVLFVKFAPVKSDYEAIISDSFNAQWSDTEKPSAIGSKLSQYDGNRWLQSGFVKLLFGSGAEVIIESPARFEILSEDELVVLSGKVYSKVPEAASGFMVRTPNSKITDLGTEFGVEVFDRSSSVHMIKGKALVLPKSSLREQNPIELTAGLAKNINSNGIVDDIRVNYEKFVSDVSSKMQTIYRAGKVYHIGRWSSLLNADLNTDLKTDGYLVEAYNLGPESTKMVTVGGINFLPLEEGGIVTGGMKEEIADKFQAPSVSGQGMSPLLTTGMALNKQQRSIEIQINDLEIGQEYRIQMIFNFPWSWTDVNCYGVYREHLYFANTTDIAALGLVTYCWKTSSTTEKIKITYPTPKPSEWNLVYFLGYVVHQVNEADTGSL